MATLTLADWGWNERLEEAWKDCSEAGRRVGRILSQREDVFTLVTAEGPLQATAAGVMFHKHDKESLPAVGDWVVLEVSPEGDAVVTAVLPRSSRFLREAPGGRGIPQIVASNVDVVFLVTPTTEINCSRLERFMVAISGCGAEPVIVLSKGDLASEDERAEAVEKTADLMDGLQVITTTTPWSRPEKVRQSFAPFLRPATTYALVGASGAGKSTLLNALIGEVLQQTGAVRETDGKGRHVTSFRQLFILPGGALVMDTPGMRELAPWSDEGGIDRVFSDISQLSQRCRFASCAHEAEPGCAVQDAVEDGTLCERRLANWRTLRSEIEGNQERREIMQARREREYFQRKKNRQMRHGRRRS